MTGSPGAFIVFEGGDGVGKTTQLLHADKVLHDLGHPPVMTREPGATAVGAHIRSLLLDPEMPELHPMTEALLFAADRAEHVRSVVRPALDSGRVVVSDRYMYSSVAYQGGGLGLTPEIVRSLSLTAAGGLLPDLVVLLDLDPAVGLARVRKQEFSIANDKIEARESEFHEKLRASFLDQARAEPDRFAVIDASASEADVASAVRSAITATLSAKKLC